MDRYRVKPGKTLHLKDLDPDETSAFKGGKEEGLAKIKELTLRLDQLQEVLYAQSLHKVLIVVQAMDTGGKDGIIRRVFDGVNPQGVKVASFKVPTPIEAAHDYLWRVHPNVPGKGEMVIFNRSHYEQVLVVRVHTLEPETRWRKHYQQIREFERMLVEEGVTILKFFLHISKEEQKKRLLERIETPEKRWKFNAGDLDERQLWDDYMKAYEDALNETSTEGAPWYTVPANRNWFRDLVVASVLVKTLESLDMHYPESKEDLAPYALRLKNEK
jgi:PPK2 family polyphosphate:nucleotide phosphotransferase